MGGKHKKNLRSEKAKVKLKGAKLPKGLNVTKTDFKVKKIVIREQIHESQIEDGRRKQGIKETMTRIKHHNTGIRLEALRTLKDIIQSYPVDVFKQLGPIIQGVSTICMDVEKEPRRESFKVLETLFSSIHSDSVEPFFHIISSYLRCAMTHIQPILQEDSLLLLDVLIKYLPKLVASSSDKLFADFLDMISKLRTDAKPGRTLTVNMGNNTTTIKWRNKVVERLQRMLKVMVENKMTALKQGTTKDTQKQITHGFVLNEPQYYPLTFSICNVSSNVSDLFINSSVPSDDLDESEKIKGYIEHLMPLLFESWLEVGPTTKESGNSSNIQLVLSHDAAFTLKTVLEILQHIWQLTELLDKERNNRDLSDWFKVNYANDFVNNFLVYFPYQQAEGITASKKQLKGQPTQKEINDAGGQNCLQQNLNICYLFCIYFKTDIQCHRDFVNKIMKFLNRIILQMNYENCFVILDKALREILFVNGNAFLKINEQDTRLLLRNVVTNFQAGKFNKDGSTKILTLLCDIVLSTNMYNKYGPSEFDDWISTLPQLLLKPSITQQTIIALSNLSKQKNEIFLNSLKKCVINVIENIPKIHANGSENQFEGKKLIMNLFYWIEDFTMEERQRFNEFIDNTECKDKRLSPYFKFILCEPRHV